MPGSVRVTVSIRKDVFNGKKEKKNNNRTEWFVRELDVEVGAGGRDKCRGGQAASFVSGIFEQSHTHT